MLESQNVLCFFHVEAKGKKGGRLQSSLKPNANNCWMRKQTKGYQQLLPSFRREAVKRHQQKRANSMKKK